MYSEKVMENFTNPQNVGEIENADGIGQVGNPVCGDVMKFYIKVEDGHLADVKFKTFGCGAAIAVSSMISQMAIGKTLEEAGEITNERVEQELDGLPKNKMHCSNLGADALRKAIEDYNAKKAGGTGASDEALSAPGHAKDADGKCTCPYCDATVKDSDICGSCGEKIK